MKASEKDEVKQKIPSIKELREICQPKKEYWPWRDKFLRGVSIYITKPLLYTKITPNDVTWLMLIVGIVAAEFYAIGGYFYTMIGLFLHHFSFILDAVDGEIARYTKKTSMKGVYLDLMSHVILQPLLIMGIAIGVWRNNLWEIPDVTFLFLGFIGAYSLLMLNFIRVKKYEMFVKKEDFKTLKKMDKKYKEEPSWLRNEILFLASFEIFNLMFFFTVLNLLHYLVIIYAVIFTLYAIIKFYMSYKYFDRTW